MVKETFMVRNFIKPQLDYLIATLNIYTFLTRKYYPKMLNKNESKTDKDTSLNSCNTIILIQNIIDRM